MCGSNFYESDIKYQLCACLLDTKSVLQFRQNIFKLRSRKMGYIFKIFLTFSEYPNFTIKNGITLSLIDDRPIEKFESSSWLESGNPCSLQTDNFVPPQFIRVDIFFLNQVSLFLLTGILHRGLKNAFFSCHIYFFHVFFLDFYFPFLFGLQFLFNSFSICFQFYCGHLSWILPSW